MEFVYRLVMDTGQEVLIQAKSRGHALMECRERIGCNLEWLKDHCKVVCLGRAENAG